LQSSQNQDTPATVPLIRPRLTDYHGLLIAQSELDFAIPFVDEDIPLYVDPFLLWSSPSLQDTSLHGSLIDAFNRLGYLAVKGDERAAIQDLIIASECPEVGLGLSRSRRGQRIGMATATEILAIFKDIPKYRNNGFDHIEEIQLFVGQIAKDRISDFACTFLKSFLIDYTIQESQRHSIPLTETQISNVYDHKRHKFVNERVPLPLSPVDGTPILFVPKRWLRFTPWLAFDEYFADYCPRDQNGKAISGRAAVLTFNRHNYGAVEGYVKAKELKREDCHNDPLFSQIPLTSAKASLRIIRNLKTGTKGQSDKKYEREMTRLLASLLYPRLDFAAVQSRTDSGTQIRDLVFTITRAINFCLKFTRILNRVSWCSSLKMLKPSNAKT
jgi:hypothetical protein